MIYRLQIRRSTQQTYWDQLLPDRGSDLQIESSIPKALPSDLRETSIPHTTGTQSQVCRETVALQLLWRCLSAFSHLPCSNPYLTESTEKIKSSCQPTLGECAWVRSPGSCQDVMCGPMLGIGITGCIRKQHWAETQPVSRRPKIN